MDTWVVEVLREGYRILFSRGPPLSDQPLPMSSYPPSSIRGKALEKEFLDLLHKGLWVLATHHRPIYPEHIYRVTTLPYGDSSVRPTLHSPGRLDDLTGPSGRIPSGSNPPGIASVSSLHHERSPIPVQGTVLRANNCPSGLYKAHGSNIRHSPSLRYQDAPISRRLVDLSRVQGHLYSSEGQAPTSVRGVGTTSWLAGCSPGSLSFYFEQLVSMQGASASTPLFPREKGRVFCGWLGGPGVASGDVPSLTHGVSLTLGARCPSLPF